MNECDDDDDGDDDDDDAVGATVGGVAATGGRLPPSLPERAQDAARPAPRSTRPAGRQLPHPHARSLRVREAPQGRRLGGPVPRRPRQRCPAAAHLLPAEPPLPALLRPRPRPLQGPLRVRPRRRRPPGLAHPARTVDQHAQPRKTLNVASRAPCRHAAKCGAGRI